MTPRPHETNSGRVVATARKVYSVAPPYAASVGVVAGATAVAAGVFRLVRVAGNGGATDLSNVVMVYLLAVVFVAVRLGFFPAVLATVVGVAAFDWLFVPPFYTLAVLDSQYLVTFAVILIVGGLVSGLTTRVRVQASLARRGERRTAALLDLSRKLAEASDPSAVGCVVAAGVGGEMGASSVLLLPGADDRLSPLVADGAALNAVERRAAEWAFRSGKPAGAGVVAAVLDAVLPPPADGIYLPLSASRETVGVLGVRPTAKDWRPDAEQVQLLEGFAGLTAAALERIKLSDEARAAWERVEAEFLRNTLLSSVSHDLRTPLAAIAGTAETLVESGDSLDPQVRRELAATVLDESRRLARLVNNLLDATRLESGGLRLEREWVPLAELTGSALHRLRDRLAGRPVRVDLPADLPMFRIDAVAFEQVLVNLLDNAVEHTPAGTEIQIAARAGDPLTMEVADRGPGLPAGAESRVFDKFFRAPSTGRHQGIGLGLAICRGIVEAHGGRISAANRPGGGALFRVQLPVDSPPPPGV